MLLVGGLTLCFNVLAAWLGCQCVRDREVGRWDTFRRCPFPDSTPTSSSPARDMFLKTALLCTRHGTSPPPTEWIWQLWDSLWQPLTNGRHRLHTVKRDDTNSSAKTTAVLIHYQVLWGEDSNIPTKIRTCKLSLVGFPFHKLDLFSSIYMISHNPTVYRVPYWNRMTFSEGKERLKINTISI